MGYDFNGFPFAFISVTLAGRRRTATTRAQRKRITIKHIFNDVRRILNKMYYFSVEAGIYSIVLFGMVGHLEDGPTLN